MNTVNYVRNIETEIDKEAIEEIKQAISNECIYITVPAGNVSDRFPCFHINIASSPRIVRDVTGKITYNLEKIPAVTYTCYVSDCLTLAEMGAATVLASNLIINNENGYIAYYEDFAMVYAALKYGTNFPVDEFSFNELYYLLAHYCYSSTSKVVGPIRSLFVGLESQWFFALEENVEKAVVYKQDMAIHKSELSKAIDDFIKEVNKVENSETIQLIRNALFGEDEIAKNNEKAGSDEDGIIKDVGEENGK